MKYVLWTIIAMVLYIAFCYYDRGYWAIGAEILFPAMAFVLYSCKEEESR